jgi:hypothetical protein
MPKIEEDYTAWRFDPENLSPRYECELPADVREELKSPRRPRILRQSARPERGGFLKWVGAFGLATLVLVGVIANYHQGRNNAPATPAPDLVLQHSREILAAPPVSGWHSDGTAYGKAGVIGHRAAPRRAT